MHEDDTRRTYKVLICDLVGLRLDASGAPDCSEVRRHVQDIGCVFHEDTAADAAVCSDGRIHFFYRPELNAAQDLLREASGGAYDAVIAAATVIPAKTVFRHGGVRIGAGTGNMQSESWGGGAGQGGEAPLMNTPGINSRATAHMVIKAILRVMPDLPFETLHERCVAGAFDTGRDLRDFPTAKIEGKRIAVLGYGNIGREVARLASAFGLHPVVYARAHHRDWIESEGFAYAATPLEAADGADLLTPHLGLGALDAETGRYANAGVIGTEIFRALAPGAVLVNFDRGELVDTKALDAAIASGKVRHAAIDADIFRDEATGELTGPLVPYLDLAKRHPGRLLLLPHATADTDHPTRVAGARQAVDQIVEAIRFRRVGNFRGDVPSGYTAIAGRSIRGIGGVTPGDLMSVAGRPETLRSLAGTAARLHAFWSALAEAADDVERRRICEEKGAGLLRDSNAHTALLRDLGLHGPFDAKPTG